MEAKSAFVLTSAEGSSAKAGVATDGWGVSCDAMAGGFESAGGLDDDPGCGGLSEDNQSGVSEATGVFSTSGEDDEAGGALVCGAAAFSQSGRSEEEPNEAGGSEAVGDGPKAFNQSGISAGTADSLCCGALGPDQADWDEAGRTSCAGGEGGSGAGV